MHDQAMRTLVTEGVRQSLVGASINHGEFDLIVWQMLHSVTLVPDFSHHVFDSRVRSTL
jgi:hypothetical protein